MEGGAAGFEYSKPGGSCANLLPREQNGASSSAKIAVIQLNQHGTPLKVIRYGIMALLRDTSRTRGQVVILRHRRPLMCFEVPLGAH